MMDSRVNVYQTVPELEAAAARKLTEVMHLAVRDRGVCLMVLSGGETPRGVYRCLGTLPERVDWDRVHIIFADERMVPPDDPQSNFGMVRREFLDHVPIPEGNIHRVRGEDPPDAAARDYGRDLRELFRATSDRFDVVMLGVGDDGHTASIFPGSDVLHEHEESVRAVFIPRLDAWRVTLTLPPINRAREVVFLVSGKHKAAIVRRVLGAAGPADDLPATMVRPSPGILVWLLDKEAASALNGEHRLSNHPGGKDSA